MAKVKVKSVEVERWEGKSELCGIKKCFPSISDANVWLLGQASTLPQGGGYDKHGFKLVFEDGEEYEGRLDCKHPSENNADLDIGKHVVDYLSFCANLRRPEWMSDDDWERSKKYNEDNGVEECKSWLDKYDFA